MRYDGFISWSLHYNCTNKIAIYVKLNCYNYAGESVKLLYEVISTPTPTDHIKLDQVVNGY